MYSVDVNCDMGESFCTYRKGQDEKVIQFVSSVNIACGFHAGDPAVMKKTVRIAAKAGVEIGAHPGFDDLPGFGRRKIDLTPEEVYDLVVYQIGALQGFCVAEGVTLHHVKAHGALYNMAARDEAIADAIAEAVAAVDDSLLLYGLAGSCLIKAGEKYSLKTVSEAFSDRTYQSDGSLTPRSNPQALIHDKQAAAEQVIRMVREQKVSSIQGKDVGISPETICIHGDGEKALEFAACIKEKLEKSDIKIRAAKKKA